MRKLIALALLAAACASTRQTPAARDIDRFVNGVLQAAPEAPSLGIAVVQDGRTIYLHESDTAYYIGSTTKAYTGLACAILASRGQLDLDAPITKYLPEVTLKKAPTLRQFLTHTSEIENSGIVFRTAYTGEHTQSQLIAMLSQSNPGKPGFHYDNLGYVVASLVIERITGKPWQVVLDDLVFTSLGMNHTSAYMSEAQKWPMPKPYYVNRNGEVAVMPLMKNDQMMHAAGGIVTTAGDLARWLNANILGSGGGIPRAAFDEAEKLQTPTPIQRGDFKSSGYGFGWYRGDYRGEAALFHGGGFPGWQSFFSFLPERKIGVGVMTNASGASNLALMAVTSYVYDRLLGKQPDAAARIEQLKADIAKGRAAMLADVEKRSKRTWMLKHPNDAYTGRYLNPELGTMEIHTEGDHLVASMANLQSVLEPFTQPEAARVEIVPAEGEVLQFAFTNSAKADSVKWGDDVFQRVP
jgi:CubicO group peptidase (beta-lactamase class C family)